MIATSMGERARRSVVCIVDDEPAVRELLCTLCESKGLTAEAYDGAESFLHAHAYRPIEGRCLVLDCNLPGMSGIELLMRLEELGIRLPVLLISGMADATVLSEALKLRMAGFHWGIAGFYRKPFDTQALLGRILTLVGHEPAACERITHPRHPGRRAPRGRGSRGYKA
jgi:two-component system response regulator FixJ